MNKLDDQIKNCNELLVAQTITLRQDSEIINEPFDNVLTGFTVDELDLQYIGDEELAAFSNANIYGVEYIVININKKNRYFYFTTDSFFNHKITQLSDYAFVKFYGYDDIIKVDFEMAGAKK